MIGRPPGKTGRTQLKQEDLIRIQVLYRDAKMGPTEIHRVTGYTIHQIKYALKKKTTEVGKRPGRPRKGESPQKKGDGAQAGGTNGEGSSGRDVDMELEESVVFHSSSFEALLHFQTWEAADSNQTAAVTLPMRMAARPLSWSKQQRRQQLEPNQQSTCSQYPSQQFSQQVHTQQQAQQPSQQSSQRPRSPNRNRGWPKSKWRSMRN